MGKYAPCTIEVEKRVKNGWTYRFILLRNGKRIGNLDVDVDHFVQLAYIHQRYRGRGYGKVLYEAAIKDFGRLRSGWEHFTSDDAKRVWTSLKDKYHSRFIPLPSLKSRYFTMWNKEKKCRK